MKKIFISAFLFQLLHLIHKFGCLDSKLHIINKDFDILCYNMKTYMLIQTVIVAMLTITILVLWFIKFHYYVDIFRVNQKKIGVTFIGNVYNIGILLTLMMTNDIISNSIYSLNRNYYSDIYPHENINWNLELYNNSSFCDKYNDTYSLNIFNSSQYQYILRNISQSYNTKIISMTHEFNNLLSALIICVSILLHMILY